MLPYIASKALMEIIFQLFTSLVYSASVKLAREVLENMHTHVNENSSPSGSL